MGYSQADKLESHDRIVDTASRRLRERGFDGVSLSEVMRESGMTAGAFYKHFDTRDDLLAESLIAALAEWEPWQESIATDPVRALRAYLSKRHRDDVAESCPISSLANDVSRSVDEVRDIYTERVKFVFEAMEKALPPGKSANNKQRAMLVFSACVGAMALSRAVSDPKLSKQLLDGVINEILAG